MGCERETFVFKIKRREEVMRNMKRKIVWTLSSAMMMALCCPAVVFAAEEEYVP